jgi:hypothetical protein
VLLDPISAQPPDRTTGINSPSTLSKILSVSDFVLFKGPLACEIKAMYGNYLAITKKSIKLEDLYCMLFHYDVVQPLKLPKYLYHTMHILIILIPHRQK